MSPVAIVFIVLGGLILIILGASVRIVKQSTAKVVERLGKYYKTLTTGVHVIFPFIDRCSPEISLKERVADFPPQPIITKDNVTMQIDTVVYYQVTDPKLYSYGVERPMSAIENLTATTLRNIVGELELDETLTSRDTVNSKMRKILDEATDPWGIKINRVELKNIDPPKAIREAMEKQMRAERERREAILLAEGEKRSNILIAEGEKEAQILRAEAQKTALIKEAEGKAEAIKKIVEANPNNAYLTLEGYEALKAVADGNSTKLIVPTDLASITSLVSSVTETITTNKEVANKKEKVAKIEKNEKKEKAEKIIKSQNKK